jgi:hypothetical protein
MSADTARNERETAIIRGAMRFLALMSLGMPLAVVGLYYSAGWKAAVLAFPLLLSGLLRRLGSDEQDRPIAFSRLLRLAIGLAVLIGVPVAAVGRDQPEIMRVWPYVTGLPMMLSIALDKRGRIPRGAAVVAGLAFVIGSELFWFYGSMSGWIWFHAFSFPLLMFGSAFLSVAISRGERKRRVLTTETLEPPPRAEGDVSGAASPCVVASDGRKRIYDNPSLSQALAIYDSDWREQNDWVEDSKSEAPSLTIFFGAAGSLVFKVDGPDTNTAQWTFVEPEKGKFIGRPTIIAGSRVPVSLGHALIADVWDDDVESMRRTLGSFEKPLAAR